MNFGEVKLNVLELNNKDLSIIFDSLMRIGNTIEIKLATKIKEFVLKQSVSESNDVHFMKD